MRVKYVIGIGHGAGANIMMRFGMVHSQRCLGIVLLHPTAMNATLFDNIAVRKKHFYGSLKNIVNEHKKLTRNDIIFLYPIEYVQKFT